MPELPEVETIRRSLEPLLVGRRIVGVRANRRDLRLPLAPGFEAGLTQRRIESLRRRAKYLIFDLDDGNRWIVHLGMSGNLLHSRDTEIRGPGPHDHVIVAVEDGAEIVFRDPRRFGLMLLVRPGEYRVLAELGPEPLDEGAFTSAYLAAYRRRTRRTLKEVLMDQRVVAGLGNIYVNEILFAAGVRPSRRMPRVARAECAAVVTATRKIVAEAIQHRGSSISDFLDGIGRAGRYQWRHMVYDRAGEPCSRCGTPIRVRVIGQRASYFCSSCQR